MRINITAIVAIQSEHKNNKWIEYKTNIFTITLYIIVRHKLRPYTCQVLNQIVFGHEKSHYIEAVLSRN